MVFAGTEPTISHYLRTIAILGTKTCFADTSIFQTLRGLHSIFVLLNLEFYIKGAATSTICKYLWRTLGIQPQQ